MSTKYYVCLYKLFLDFALKLYVISFLFIYYKLVLKYNCFRGIFFEFKNKFKTFKQAFVI